VQILKILDIQPSNEYLSVAIKLLFDLPQDDFHNMHRNYIGEPTYDATPFQIPPYDRDDYIFTVPRDNNSISYGFQSDSGLS